MKNKFWIHILLLQLTCVACNFSTSYEKFKTLADEVWERDSNYRFEFNIKQPGRYLASTCIRHTTDYKQRNISCSLTISYRGMVLNTLHADLFVADENGKWIGQGLGGLKTVIQPIREIFHFDSTGIYTIEIKHRMRDRQLKGIKNIGIKITHGEE